MTAMKRLREIKDIAYYHVGIKEGTPQHKAIIDTYNQIKPLPRNYKVKYTDSWCAVFVSVVMLQANIPNFPYECGVHEMLEALYSNNCCIRGRSPHTGELIFFKPSHTGIVTGYNKGAIYTIDGNSADSVRQNIYRIDDPNIYCFASPFPYTKEDIIQQVNCGWYGNDENRKKCLEMAGYNYMEIQKGVNQLHGMDKR